MTPNSTATRLLRFRAAPFVAAASLLCSTATQAALQDGLVAYWPLDSVAGGKTPDLVSGYDMDLVNLTEADLVDGKVGKAFRFENARQTILQRVNTPGEQLPINQHPALTIAMWVNVVGTGQSDLRLFSEGNTANNNPLFNLGTHNGGANGAVDFYFRQDPWATVNHLHTLGEPLDGTWHHIAFVQQEDGSRSFYIDGVIDMLESGEGLPPKPEGNWNLNTTTIGGILRANATHWVTGLIDEVMLWRRALTEAEIQQVVNEGLSSVFSPLTQGMVAYWPLDEVVGVKTPDLVSGYDMDLVNLTEADLVDGRWGKAFHFENARQTILQRINAPGEKLPINQHPALTISMWVKVVGTGQSDLRLFSEGNTGNNNPLFNLGTHNGGANGSVDFYFRQAPWATVNHLHTLGEPLDGTWHHIVFVQQEDGSRSFYIDGVIDMLESGEGLPPKEPGDWNLNTTTIGGILRANATHWVTGDIDDVALWSRALSEEEIQSLYNNGTPVPFSQPQPLAIRSFTADLPAVAVGDSVVLSWDVTKGAQVSIDQGVGDVTAQTVSGVGSIAVPITTSRTFTLTLSRGTESLTASVSVAAIDGVAEGWTLIDNFDRYEPGFLNQQGGWADLDAVDWEVVEDGGNKYAVPNAGGATARLLLGRFTMVEGDERTLFFRVKWTGDEFEPIGLEVALTDRAVRFGTDTGDNIGPGAVISTETGFHLVGGYNGWQGGLDFGPWDPVLQADTIYNVWVDIKNGPFDVDPVDPSFVYSTGDIYSIHVQKDGDATRSTIISEYVASRDPVGQADIGFTRPNLDKLIIGTLGTQSTTRNVFIDDIYLSKSGYNATVPRAAGFTEPVGGGGGGPTPTLAIALSGTQIQITYSGGTLESSDSLTGGWAPVAGASSPYVVTPDAPRRFYRVRQ